MCRAPARHGIYTAQAPISSVLIEAMECDVSDVRHSSYGSPHPRDTEVPLGIEERNTYPTPGEIIGQIARVIAVCLGLGLLARVLVAFTGMH
jgi:hypothetical protein